MGAALDDTVLCDLAHYGWISVSGDDATDFLQGQLTCDLQRLADDTSLLAGYCSPQGRLLACPRLFRRSGRYLLRLPAELIGPTVQRLRLFVLRARVELQELDGGHSHLGLTGPDSARLLADHLSNVPETIGQVVHGEIGSIARVPGLHPRFELFGPAAQLGQLRQALTASATPAGAESWQLAEILAGLPEIFPATRDTFIPQMLNLDLIGGIALDKGCYVGQEIVARTHYLGRLKRRMFRLHSEQTVALQAGDAPVDADGDDARPRGRVVQAVTSPEDGTEMLAVLTMADLPASGSLRLHCRDTAFTARIEDLPYPVPAPSGA